MPAAALCWLSLPQMGEMGWTQFPGPALTIFRGKLGLRAMSCWSLGSQLRLGLGPGLAGGLGVRAKEPAVPARAEEAGAAGGRGARGPPRRSQAASRPLIRNSFSMNSGVPASLPRPTHRFLPGPPPAGWEARLGLPGPQVHSQTARGGSQPSCPPLTPTARPGRGLSGVSWLAVALPLCHTSLAWAGVACLPAAAAALPGLGGGQGKRARPGGPGQACPAPQAPAGKVTWRPSPPGMWVPISAGAPGQLASPPLFSVSSSVKWEENTFYLLGR